MASQNDLKHAKIYFILGGSGSGKRAMCEKIVAKYGFTHLSTGDMLKAEVASGSTKGKELGKIMEKGDLVSSEVVLGMLRDAMLKKASSSKGFLIHGYPTELEQAKRFESDVAAVKHVIYLKATDDTMKKRLLKRGETNENIAKRIKTFHTQTQAVIDHYEKHKKVCTIAADGSDDEIFKKVEAFLDKN